MTGAKTTARPTPTGCSSSPTRRQRGETKKLSAHQASFVRLGNPLVGCRHAVPVGLEAWSWSQPSQPRRPCSYPPIQERHTVGLAGHEPLACSSLLVKPAAYTFSTRIRSGQRRPRKEEWGRPPGLPQSWRIPKWDCGEVFTSWRGALRRKYQEARCRTATRRLWWTDGVPRRLSLGSQVCLTGRCGERSPIRGQGPGSGLQAVLGRTKPRVEGEQIIPRDGAAAASTRNAGSAFKKQGRRRGKWTGNPTSRPI